MKVAFILKGLIRKKQTLLRKIKNSFPGAEIFETAHAAHAVELAKNASEKECSHIIAVGGDGTLSEIVNGIISSDRENLPVVGLLSYGTANDFSKTIKMDGSIGQLKKMLEKNSVKKIDIGNVKFIGKDNKTEERFFINIADIGIGGYIVENINKSHKFFGADATFFIETLKAMFSFKRTKVKCASKEFNWEGKTLSMVMANGKYFGSGLCIAPDAGLSDGKFSIVVLGDVTIIDYLKNLNKVKRGEKIIHPEVFYKETNEIEIIPLESKCPIDLDGEFIGYAPAKFKIIPLKIDFLME